MADALIKLQTMMLTRFERRGERGASLVEYALLISLIALVCFAAMEFLGGEAETRFNDTGESFASFPGPN